MFENFPSDLCCMAEPDVLDVNADKVPELIKTE